VTEASVDPSEIPSVMPAKHAQFPCFDGLRAIAAFLVIFEHIGFPTGKSNSGWAAPFLSRMDIGVAIFFAISGFLLYRPFVAGAFSGKKFPELKAFWWRRALRILPAYWCALTIMILFFNVRVIDGWKGYLAHYSLVQIYTSLNVAKGGINQSWTLAVEMTFYLFLPLYAFVVRRIARGRSSRNRMRIELLGLGVLIAVAEITKALIFASNSRWAHDLGIYWLPTNLDWFAAGMVLAVVSGWAASLTQEPGWLRRVGDSPWVWWGIALGLFVFFCKVVNLPLGLPVFDGKQFFVRQVFMGSVAFALLVPAVFGKAEVGRIRQFLQWAPVAYLGVISYGVYLWHQAWAKKAEEWTRAPLFRGSFMAILSITVVWSVVSASISYFVVERPILSLKDVRWWERSPPVDASRASKV
jgi:peptidoglycan/LPS O-acetylase OafA/YrhL